MSISKKLAGAINQQIGNELGASIQYLQIASYFESEDMLLFAKLFFAQSDEEHMHAMKFLRHLLDAGAAVSIPAIAKARDEFKSAEDAVKAALDWEQEVTRQINALMELAAAEKDYASEEFLAWFVTEQVEEVSKMESILNIVGRAGDNLLMAETYVSNAFPPA
jgi:ferritin